ncbi:MAG: AAA family ATPase, partial [Lachnospiraceae bacterium]|nr:AAA family ATPase [Lachnospiraceae bacterium]
MLESLHVKNVALIDESHVNFGEGLNILTGETGAGKSMIIGSINLALGGKGDKSLIRSGAEYALVQLLFRLKDEATIAKLKELDIYPDEENRLLLERRISPAKSVSKINGELIAHKQLKEAAELIIDIHGQHEHQSQLKKSSHLSTLDAYCGEQLQPVTEELERAYKSCRELEKELEQLYEQGENREKELSFARFEFDEIASAKLTEGEDEELESLGRKMSNAQKIAQALGLAGEAVSGQGENASALIERAFREIRNVASYDSALEELSQQFATLEDILYTVGHAIHECERELEFDEQQFGEVQERLNLINQLKSKYAR